MAQARETWKKKRIRPEDIRAATDLVLGRVGGGDSANARAAATDASLKHGLAKVAAGKVQKKDLAEVVEDGNGKTKNKTDRRNLQTNRPIIHRKMQLWITMMILKTTRKVI